MKLTTFTLRDLFWLTLVAAIAVFAFMAHREKSRLQAIEKELKARGEGYQADTERLRKQSHDLAIQLDRRGWRFRQTDDGLELWHKLDEPQTAPTIGRELRPPFSQPR